ncbi:MULTISPECIES: response regulator transcription factor [Acidobacterium]|nr:MULTISPECIES: response regulator transcription factor [Acidobacterium]
MPPKIRVLIVDDHPVVRAGLTSMLSTKPQLHMLPAASGGAEALTVLEEEQVDVVLLDLKMPGINGIEVLHRLNNRGALPRTIILSSYEMDEDIYRAIQAGARGYLIKDTTQEEILEAIAAVHAGSLHLPRHIAQRISERIGRQELTRRETEILEMLAKGLTNKEIGRVFGISENTARNHVNSIIQKLEVSDRTEAATTAILRGIIQFDH